MVLSQGRKKYTDYIALTVGTFLLSFAISVFFEPFQLVTGGVSGLGIIIKSLTTNIVDGGIPVAITNAVFNVPLFALALIIKGKGFGAKSLLSTILLSIFLIFTSKIPTPVDDMLLSTVYGGVISGIGLGLVFSAYSTTGGTDLAAALLQKIFPHVSVATLMLIIDWSIIATGLVVFGLEKSMYAIIAVFITARVIDAILDGLHHAKAAFIISDIPDEIAKNIMETTDRGATVLYGKGMYSQQDKEVLLCVVSKREIVKLKEIVKLSDERAFVIVTDVREVLGEGFIE